MFEAIRHSVRGKAILLVLASTVSALALSALGLVLYDLRAYERQWTTDLTTQAEILARASAPALSFDDRATAAKDLALLKVRPFMLAGALYTRSGDLFATYAKPGFEPSFPPRPGPEGYAIQGDQLSVFHRVAEEGETIGTVYLVAYYRPWSRLLDYLTIIGLVMIASLAVTALFSGWLQSAITMPILEVARVAREVMSQRDYSLRARKTTDDEIGELVDSFNAMLAESGRRAQELRDADQRKDEFLATLAHELRNPLAPLRNALEILRMKNVDPASGEKARQMMQRQLAQMVRLVDDLLDVSRITTGKLAVRREPLALQAAVQDAIETVRPLMESRRHELDVSLPAEPLMVLGDRTRLAQVFSNLLNNAAKYTESGGRVWLSLEAQGGEAVLRVRDSGIGLDPHALSTIFDMFVQVDRSLERTQAGLGVGLTLAKRLVTLHGGTIAGRSDGGGLGSEFEVRLPLATAAVAGEGAQAPEAAAAVAARRLRILVADDNVDAATSFAALLAARGHEVRVAHDGAQALAIARSFEPDVAFLDIGMPRVQGYEVARRMREEEATRRTLLVALTGWGRDDDRQRASEAGFDRHLVKPPDPEEIDRILEGAAARTAPA
ncbi:MAG TPA: ATP-binding protein [Usitatibacter sp.]|jgi:signal transduction histidine kinase/ActR/RegA family two-component response regulator|nr:ATP-binding protein [Usitatibacter sp.]